MSSGSGFGGITVEIESGFGGANSFCTRHVGAKYEEYEARLQSAIMNLLDDKDIDQAVVEIVVNPGP